MNKKLALELIDFADSEFRSFSMSEEDNLTIYMKNWKEEPFRLFFKHAIQFTYVIGDVPKDLYELSDSSFLKEAIQKRYIKMPLVHPFKHYQMEDIDDFPFIQVIAENVEVFKD